MQTQNHEPAASDSPRRLRDADIAGRYGVTLRTGGEWLRAAVAAGVLRKLKRMTVGRWSAMDAWVESGGNTTGRKAVRS